MQHSSRVTVGIWDQRTSVGSLSRGSHTNTPLLWLILTVANRSGALSLPYMLSKRSPD